MKAQRMIMWGFVAAAGLAAGCRAQPYGTSLDPKQAQDEATLVVRGYITRNQDVRHYTGDEIQSLELGKAKATCVAEREVTIQVERVVKGEHYLGQMTFQYYGPCLEADVKKGVLFNVQEPGLVPGDLATVWLTKHGDQWRLLSLRRESEVPPGYE